MSDTEDKPAAASTTESTNKPSSEASTANSGSASSLFGSFLGADTSQKAWGFWESAQKQAQEAWKSYDSEKLKKRLHELGRTATEYIDEADRRIESIENGAVSYIQQRGTEIAEKVKEAAHQGVVPSGSDQSDQNTEVIFTGPERKSLSRLDAELMALNSSPLRILEATTTADNLSKSERQQLLVENLDLKETYISLVPAKLSESEFWGRYGALRAELQSQDERRKQLIGKPGLQTEDDLDDWGSSDEEDTKAPEDKAEDKAKDTNDKGAKDIKDAGK